MVEGVWALVSDQICLIYHLSRGLLKSYGYHKRGWYLIGGSIGRIIETAFVNMPEIIFSLPSTSSFLITTA